MTPTHPTNRSILKNFLRYAVPSTLAMLATSLYVVIEGIILGQGVGAHALAAVNIAFPATMLMNVFMMAISFGGANLMSIRLGEDKKEDANNIFMQSLTLMVCVTLIFILLGNIFLRQICTFFGADSSLLPDVMIFVKFFLFSTLPFTFMIGTTTFVRNDGNPQLSMYSSLVGTIATAIICYLFVFHFKLGIVGAAIAGGLGNLFSLAILSIHFIRKKGILKFTKPRFLKADITKIITLGFPTAMTELAMTFTAFCFNLIVMRRIGEIGISAYSIANYVNAFMLLFLMGLSQGIQPIVSYNFGAKEYKVVTQTYKIAVISTLVISISTILVVLVARENIVRIFNNESAQLVELGKTVLLYGCLAYLPSGLNMVNITFFQSIENPKLSAIISFLRGFVFVQLGLLTLPLIMGNDGIWVSTFIGESLALIATLFISKKLHRMDIQPIPCVDVVTEAVKD